MTAVVTGATGMLGIALIERLTRENFKIYAVVRPGSERLVNIPVQSNVTVVECDLNEILSLPDKIREKCDYFFHLAWDSTYGDSRNNMGAQIDNIRASADAVNAAHALGCGTFLGAGSQAEYGRKPEKISPGAPAEPENGYGAAKLCAGQITRIMCKQLSLRHIWCRLFSVYGPFDAPRTMVMSGIMKMLNGEKPLYTKGEQQWDYIYCDDAANALYLAAANGKDGGVYCVGSGQTKQMSEYIAMIRNAVAPNAEIGIGEIPYFENQVMYLCADIDSLKKDTGFEPTVSFEAGIKKRLSGQGEISVRDKPKRAAESLI